MKVAVIGQGYVGLPLAISIARAGHIVIGFDLNPDVVIQLNSGKSHIEDVKDSDLHEIIKKNSYVATTNQDDLGFVDVAIIAVPTPLNQIREPDISYVEAASRMLGESLKTSCLIVNESTSYPGTLREVIAPTVMKSGKEGLIHRFAVSPERVDPGNTIWRIENTPRLMAGLTPEATDEVVRFYKTFCEEVISVSSPEVAEAAKLFENTFRQVNIALVNEFSSICKSFGISAHEVLDAANSKPYGFMKFTPGVGVGGHCIPVDPTFLAYSAASKGSQARFIELANKVNFERPSVIIKEISHELGENLEGKNILLVGISYKPNIADVRESPSLRLLHLLREKNSVVWFDPVVGLWNGEESATLDSTNFDIVIFSHLHKETPVEKISALGSSVFDLTGKVKNAISS